MTKALNYGVLLLIFFTLLLTEVMPPTPTTFFHPSIILLGVAILTAVLIIAYSRFDIKIKLDGYNTPLRYALLVYLAYLLISFIIGLLSSTTALSVLRSSAPYVIFLPFLILMCLRRFDFNLNHFAWLLIIFGLLQALNCIYLYFDVNHNFQYIHGVISHRVTGKDARCTLPFIIASAVIPIHYLFNSKYHWLRYLAAAIIVISVIAAVITVVRAFILAIFCGWFIYLILYSWHTEKSLFRSFGSLFKHILLFSVVLIFLFFLFDQLSFSHAALKIFTDKLLGHTPLDYTTSRLHDEWIPALKTWSNASLLKHGLGIGSGVSFFTQANMPRTYVHNLLIYSLLYGGVIGLIAVIYIYSAAFYSLKHKAMVSHESLYLVVAAFLCSLFLYAQLFAVHKLFSYNLIFMLLLGIAFRSDIKASKR